MYNKYRDRQEVEQNPLTLVNAEQVYKTGVVPATAGNVQFNGLSIDTIFRRAGEDIFECVRDGNLYPSESTSNPE